MSPRKGECLEEFRARQRAYDRTRARRMYSSVPSHPSAWSKAVKQQEIQDGHVIIGSDMHYWPGKPRTTAHAAMVRLCREVQPSLIIANGDVLDFPKIGRHPSIGWEARPNVVDEIEIGKERLGEIVAVAPDARCIWTAGNHDLRFESTIANRAFELAGVKGVHLHDHFPAWEPAWMVEINDTVMVKHRWKGGTHAVYNNTVYSGRSIITGHLHSAQVTCFTDYNGTRYGVDTGTLAVPYDDAFIDYTEANSVNWRSAVTVLTFYNGRLLLPEQLHVFDETQRLTVFRGKVYQENE